MVSGFGCLRLSWVWQTPSRAFADRGLGHGACAVSGSGLYWLGFKVFVFRVQELLARAKVHGTLSSRAIARCISVYLSIHSHSSSIRNLQVFWVPVLG